MSLRQKLALPKGVTDKQVRDQLDRILCAESFLRSPQLSRFLRFAVEKGLAGEKNQLKELTVALEVFDRPADFDPKLDPIVRVEAGRLRSKVREYFDTVGADDRLWVGLAKRGYRPVVRVRRRASENKAETPPAVAGPSLAVLPIEDLSLDGALTPLAKALTAQLIHLLALDSPWDVAARMSIREFRDAPEDARKIADRVKVTSLLEGALQQPADDQLRLQLRLVDASSGLVTWAGTFEAPLGALPEAQQTLADKTIAALGPLGSNQL